MKVLHLSTTGQGGAAGAARRIHGALAGQGHESRLLVGLSPGDPPPAASAVFGGAADGAWNAIWPRLHGAALRLAGLRPGVAFSPGLPAIQGVHAHPWVSWSDVVCLYWVAGFVPLSSLRGFSRPLVWRLSDEWAYTGGCHYAGACEGFRTGCRVCSSFGSDGARGTRLGSALSRKGYRDRERGYAGAPLAIVAPSRWIAERAASAPLLRGCRIHQCYTGVDVDVFSPAGREQARADLGLGPADRAILFGGQDPRKGWDALVQALALLAGASGRREGEAAPTVLLLGPPPPQGSPVPVRALGFVGDPARLAALYAAADVVAVPSRQDNLPQVALEALACGTPVVAFEVGGTPEAISHGETGFVAPAGDIPSFAEGLRWALSSGRQARALARASAEERFSLATQAARFADILAEERRLFASSNPG